MRGLLVRQAEECSKRGRGGGLVDLRDPIVFIKGDGILQLPLRLAIDNLTLA